MPANTLFLRLEGPMQAWGDSKFVVRRTNGAPTKSGVVGLICCALGLSRAEAGERLKELNALAMGVRIDRPGVRWWDFHTVGAGIGLRTADGGLKTGAAGTLLTRREYLCDGSFLVALQGDERLVGEALTALRRPVWPLFLGRKSCPPAVPVVSGRDDDAGGFADLRSALVSRAWRPRLETDKRPAELECLLEWRGTAAEPEAPMDAEAWYDVAQSFEPPAHGARLVRRVMLPLDAGTGDAMQSRAPYPARARADYQDRHYRAMREEALRRDRGLCRFCREPATTVQHITYRRAGEEDVNDLKALCRLCHDAVTMIEYGRGMELDRIDPDDERWEAEIMAKRREIIASRSLEVRRRRPSEEEV